MREREMEIARVKEELEKVKRAIFFEEMADFMDWDAHFRLNRKRVELERKLRELAEEEVE